MKEIPVSFKSQGQKISAVLHLPKEKNLPVVIICHGLSGWKKSPYRIRFAKQLCKQGYAVLRFDFRGHGDSEGRDLDVTPSSGRDDLISAINWMTKQKYLDKNRIGVQGGSYGGLVALLAASKDKRIKCLSVWAPAIKINELLEKKRLKEIKRRGYCQFEPWFKVSKKYYDDRKKYNFRKIVKNISVPTLIMSGDKDESVPVDASKKFYEDLDSQKKLIIMKGVTHKYNDTKWETPIHRTMVDWFNKWLK